MIKRNQEGYYFVSDSGIRYDLFEGVTMWGDKQYTSDAIFIMLGDFDYFEKVDQFFVDYIMGANFFLEDLEQFDKDIAYMVDKYEIEHNLKK